jgi:zinc protease
MARRGPFIAGLQTRNDKLGKALDLLEEEVARFVADGPTADELEAAQKYLTGSFPLRIDSNRKIVDYLAMIGFYGLDTDYLARFTRRVEAVTRPAIRQSMAERLDPQRMVTVIVGSPAARETLDGNR